VTGSQPGEATAGELSGIRSIGAFNLSSLLAWPGQPLCRGNEPNDPVSRLGYSLDWRRIWDSDLRSHFRYHDPKIDVS